MIRLVYPTDPNFGDAMSPLIVEKLSGQKVVPSGMWDADMMAVGSVFYRGDYLIGDLRGKDNLRYAKALVHGVNCRLRGPVKVWGSGFLQYPPFEKPYFKREIKVFALRGKYTRHILETLGLVSSAANMPYGDPGLLFPVLFGIVPHPRVPLGIVPHKYDVAMGWAEKISMAFTRAGIPFKIIDVEKHPLDVVGEIAKCNRIISSSLHGLIIADSLGIPNQHMMLTTLEFNKEDFELKFRDYYSAFDKEMPRYVLGDDLLNDPMQFCKEEKFSYLDKKFVGQVQTGLLDSFPWSRK